VLTDFGLSKTESTISGAITTKSLFRGGTLAWTSPELFRVRKGKSHFTSKSDVYSYGIVVWEVLCGAYPVASYEGAELSNLPWAHMDIAEIIGALTAGERPKVSPLALSNSNVFKAATYNSIMQNCLAGEPSARPSFTEINETIAREMV
jgi:serine/threonine protein kinase